jgi:lauroyl/myristoyl acyltransferase
MSALYVPRIIPKRLATVIAEIEPKPKSARARRLRLQLAEMVDGIRRLRNGDVEIVRVNGGSIFGKLLNVLRGPGGVVIIATDASWPTSKPGGFERPFASFASHGFALGTARMARLAQCPIVTCVPFLDEQGGVTLQWGEVIPAPDRKDADADLRISNLILDDMERAVGSRPGQYVQPIGHERSWDAVARCWRSEMTAAAPEGVLERVAQTR